MVTVEPLEEMVLTERPAPAPVKVVPPMLFVRTVVEGTPKPPNFMVMVTGATGVAGVSCAAFVKLTVKTPEAVPTVVAVGTNDTADTAAKAGAAGRTVAKEPAMSAAPASDLQILLAFNISSVPFLCWEVRV